MHRVKSCETSDSKEIILMVLKLMGKYNDNNLDKFELFYCVDTTWW